MLGCVQDGAWRGISPVATRRDMLKAGASALIVGALPEMPASVSTTPAAASPPPIIDLREWAVAQNYDPQYFFLADGTDDLCTNCCGENYEPAAAGTLMLSYRCSYEYNEWESSCIQCLYDEVFFWENLSEEDLAEMVNS